MSEPELQRLLAHLGDELGSPPPHLAHAAWSSAGAARRRRRAAAASGALVAIAGIPMVFALGTPPAGDGMAAPGPHDARASFAPSWTDATLPPAGTVRIYQGPPLAAEQGLQVAPTAYAALGSATSGAEPLSAHPVRRIVAATQDDVDAPILVLADDGTWRTVDVEFAPTSDGGNRAPALQVTSISPDATRLAIPQPDELLVADVRSGAVKRYGVPGFNERMRWSRDGRLVMVGGDAGASVVDVASGAVTTVSYRAWDLVSFDATGALELGDQGLRTVDPQGRESWRQPVPGVREWWSAGWERSTLVAQAGFGSEPELGDQGVAVLDRRSGEMTDFLRLGDVTDQRSKGCCAVLGWLDDRTVLIGNSGHRVLAWDHMSGAVQRVAEVPAQVVALAPASA